MRGLWESAVFLRLCSTSLAAFPDQLCVIEGPEVEIYACPNVVVPRYFENNWYIYAR